jgi:hypothetical protein
MPLIGGEDVERIEVRASVIGSRLLKTMDAGASMAVVALTARPERP